MLTELLTSQPSWASYESLRQSTAASVKRVNAQTSTDTNSSSQTTPSSTSPDYILELSSQALRQAQPSTPAATDSESAKEQTPEKTSTTTSTSGSASSEELSEEEQKKVEELKKRDKEVKAHEQAHLSAAGSNAKGGIHYEYETGPDQNRYAVGDEVNIDTSPVKGDPQASLQKAQQIQQAALAPAEPSSQDRQVAAEANKMAAEARQELAKEGEAKDTGNTDSASTSASEPTDAGAASDTLASGRSGGETSPANNKEQEEKQGQLNSDRDSEDPLPAVALPYAYQRQIQTAQTRMSWVA